MSGLVKSPLQTAVVEGIYNDILTSNAQYYYFLGRTNPWTIAEGASPGEDGLWTTLGTGANAQQVLVAPTPLPTYRYEQDTRNNILAYKLVNPSDVSFVIPRYNWVANTVYDMYDDVYSENYPSATGALSLEASKFYVLTASNNVYKCISNNYDARSTVEPTGTSTNDFTTADGYIWKFMYNIPVGLQNKFYTWDYIPVMTSLRNRFYANGAIGSVSVQDPGIGYTTNATLAVAGDGFLENNPYSVGQNCVVTSAGWGYRPSSLITGASWTGGVTTVINPGYGSGVTGTVNMANFIIGTVTVLTGGSGFPISSTQVVTFSGGGASVQATGNATIDATGVVTAITVLTGGTGYTSAPTLSVAGGGVQPTYTVNLTGGTVSTFTLGVGGASFPHNSTQEVTFSGGGASVQATASATVNAFGVVTGITILTPGSGYTGVPTFVVHSQAYSIGEHITLRGITPSTFNGDFIITAVTATSVSMAVATTPGTYTSGGTISKIIETFSAPLWGNQKKQITGYVTVDSNGSLTAITLDPQILISGATVYGYGYDQTGTVTIAAPVTANAQWAGTTAYTLNQIVQAGDNFYIVTTAGTTNTTMPVHTTGTITFGSCALTYYAGQSHVKLVLTKTEAIMTPIIQGGSITGVIVVDGGIGYTYCNIIPQDTTPNATAILVPDITVGNIDTVQADVELMAQGRVGAISYIKMEKDPTTGLYLTGGGYGVNTTIQIIGGGVGATAVPVIVDGSIVAINLTNAGTGYKREATVKIFPEHLDTNGKYIGASARCILSPPGAHGSNAIHEFNSNTLLFYSVLSDERLHALPNNNDYRQFGVIKNPKRYGQTSRLFSSSASPCWLITATTSININNFNIDDELYQGGTELYRVVVIQDDKMVIQAITQTVPTIATFINKNTMRLGNTFAVKSVTPPQVDKFTGDILFIDNKLPFVVTVDQMIAFRTTIGF